MVACLEYRLFTCFCVPPNEVHFSLCQEFLFVVVDLCFSISILLWNFNMKFQNCGHPFEIVCAKLLILPYCHVIGTAWKKKSLSAWVPPSLWLSVRLVPGEPLRPLSLGASLLFWFVCFLLCLSISLLCLYAFCCLISCLPCWIGVLWCWWVVWRKGPVAIGGRWSKSY